MVAGKYTRTEKQREKLKLAISGEKNINWVGGRRENSTGYMLILKPEHPFVNNAGYIREHRLVMEEFLGRYLTKKEIVHHINEIRDDNRLENLILFANNREHNKYHQKLLREKQSA